MPARPVLLVEDERSISEPFARLLRLEGFDPTIAPTAKEALQWADRRTFDAVFLDLMLPDGNGRDVLLELGRRPRMAILIVSARDQPTERIIDLELGADDFIGKPFDFNEAVSRLRAVLRRIDNAGAAADVLDFGDLRVDVSAHRVWVHGEQVQLAPKEFDLLVHLARHAGSVCRRDDIMWEVWGPGWIGDASTLNTHIGWLRRKLGNPADPGRRIETVRNVGFRFAGRSA